MLFPTHAQQCGTRCGSRLSLAQGEWFAAPPMVAWNPAWEAKQGRALEHALVARFREKST